jgi:hypothetical protein
MEKPKKKKYPIPLKPKRANDDDDDWDVGGHEGEDRMICPVVDDTENWSFDR